MPGDNGTPEGFYERRAREIAEAYEPPDYGCEPGAIEELRSRADELGFTYNRRRSISTPNTDSGAQGRGRKRHRKRTTYLEVQCLRCMSTSERPSQRSYAGIRCPVCGSTWIDIQRRQLAEDADNGD